MWNSSTKSLTFVTLFAPASTWRFLVSFVDVALQIICRWNNWQNQVAVDPCECSRGQETVLCVVLIGSKWQASDSEKNRPCMDPPCSKKIWWSLIQSLCFNHCHVFLPAAVYWVGLCLAMGVVLVTGYHTHGVLKSCAMLSASDWCDVLFVETCWALLKSHACNIFKDKVSFCWSLINHKQSKVRNST